ncbi:universal stress protein [Halorhabdus sp. CBA1104]|uniref:universal stress protein n=1 Tax=unclassified Halorhabdus TaxID=2621901 RepID=UPI0012B43B4D|nr:MULTISPECIES: universal stress protein [unclassified Halorhabdus]QGN06964.1 universal stress protein [Halorhabdus sp. CBA1104]
MVDRLLVAMDDSEMAAQTLRYALDAFPDAEVTAFHVVGEPSPWMGAAMSLAIDDDLETAKRDHAESVLETAKAIGAENGREIRTDIGMGSPARAIVDRATDFDHVVIGTHSGSLVDRLLVGNVAEKVFRRSPVPVTVVR